MANWLFQANPARYDVFGDLASGEPIESWSITRHFNDIGEGDRAALWVAGQKDPGVYALGHVTGPPYEELTSADWARPEDRRVTMTFCPLHLDRILAQPVPRAVLKADPVFSRARIITQPQAGNPFLLTDEEWDVIEAHIP
jgi:hypothetical protein